MKKKLALILVLVLCAAILFTFVACKPKNDDSGNGDNNVATITDAQAIDAMNAIEVRAGRWILNNAGDTYADRSNDLRSILLPLASVGNVNPSEFRVSYNATSNVYTVRSSWGSLTKTFTIDNMVNDWGDRAGYAYLADADGEDIEDVVVGIFNSFVATILDAKAKGEAFLDDGIGFNAKAYLVAGYGVDHENIDLAIQVKGNIGTTDAATALAIEILNKDVVVYGLYFEGAEAKEDCKIYLRAGDRFLYIDHANIVSIITGLVGYEPEKAAALEPIAGLDDLLDEDLVGIVELVAAILFPNGGVISTEGDVTTYQLMLDLSELVGGIQSLLAILGEDLIDSINTIISDVLPPPLNQLDLANLEGVAGQLIISVITENGLVKDAEINLNVPTRDFRFSATDDVAKVYGPLNFAAGIQGLKIGAQTDVVPVIEDAEYFSPFNVNFTGDVTVKAVDKEDDNKVLVDSVFSFALVTEINPFNLGVANGSFIITELKNGASESVNFVTLTYDQATGDGYFIFRDEIYYTVNTIDLFNYIVDNYGEGIEEFVTNFILNMLGRYDVPVKLASAEEEGGFDFMALIGAFGNIQAWYEALVADNKVFFEIDKDDLLNSVVDVSLVTEDLNALIGVVNGIGLLPVVIPTLEQPESIEVYFNTEAYLDIFFVKVVVDGKDYIFEIDGSEWTEKQEVYVKFSIDEIDYVKITIKYEESTDKAVLVVDAAKIYTVTITLELYDEKKEDYFVLEFEANITENAAGLLNGFQFTVTDVETDKYYTVYGEGVGIWTYEGLAGIPSLIFTFEDIPHYGFGFDSNDFSLDVDIDDLYLNWGGRNADIDTVPDGDFTSVNPFLYDVIDDIMDMLGIGSNKVVY